MNKSYAIDVKMENPVFNEKSYLTYCGCLSLLNWIIVLTSSRLIETYLIQEKAFTISTLLSSVMSQMSLNDGRDSGLKVLSIITVSNQTIHEKTIAGLCRMRLYKFSNSTHQVSKQSIFGIGFHPM